MNVNGLQQEEKNVSVPIGSRNIGLPSRSALPTEPYWICMRWNEPHWICSQVSAFKERDSSLKFPSTMWTPEPRKIPVPSRIIGAILHHKELHYKRTNQKGQVKYDNH